MLNFKRLLNLRIVAITIAMALSINSTVYGTDLSDVKHLRVPLSGTAKMDEVLERFDKDSDSLPGGRGGKKKAKITFNQNDLVSHQVFGPGIIIKVHNSGEYTVSFYYFGTKIITTPTVLEKITAEGKDPWTKMDVEKDVLEVLRSKKVQPTVLEPEEKVLSLYPKWDTATYNTVKEAIKDLGYEDEDTKRLMHILYELPIHIGYWVKSTDAIKGIVTLIDEKGKEVFLDIYSHPAFKKRITQFFVRFYNAKKKGLIKDISADIVVFMLRKRGPFRDDWIKEILMPLAEKKIDWDTISGYLALMLKKKESELTLFERLIFQFFSLEDFRSLFLRKPGRKGLDEDTDYWKYIAIQYAKFIELLANADPQFISGQLQKALDAQNGDVSAAVKAVLEGYQGGQPVYDKESGVTTAIRSIRLWCYTKMHSWMRINPSIFGKSERGISIIALLPVSALVGFVQGVFKFNTYKRYFGILKDRNMPLPLRIDAVVKISSARNMKAVGGLLGIFCNETEDLKLREAIGRALFYMAEDYPKDMKKAFKKVKNSEYLNILNSYIYLINKAKNRKDVGEMAQLAIPALKIALYYEDLRVRAYAAEKIGEIGNINDPNIIERLLELLEDDNYRVCKASEDALLKILREVPSTIEIVLEELFITNTDGVKKGIIKTIFNLEEKYPDIEALYALIDKISRAEEKRVELIKIMLELAKEDKIVEGLLKKKLGRQYKELANILVTHIDVIGDRLMVYGPRYRELGEAIEHRDTERVKRIVLNQKNRGVKYILVHTDGMEAYYDLDTVIKSMKWIIKVLEELEIPILIDSGKVEVLAEGAKAATGKVPIILNSINLKKVGKIIPVIEECKKVGKKIGVVVVGSGEGAILVTASREMSSTDKNCTIAKSVISKIKGILDNHSIFFDASIGALIKQFEEGNGEYLFYVALKAMQRMKEEYPDIQITVGVNNVSVGEPNLSLLHRTFTVIAMGCGLNVPIANPLDIQYMATIEAGELLMKDWGRVEAELERTNGRIPLRDEFLNYFIDKLSPKLKAELQANGYSLYYLFNRALIPLSIVLKGFRTVRVIEDNKISPTIKEIWQPQVDKDDEELQIVLRVVRLMLGDKDYEFYNKRKGVMSGEPEHIRPYIERAKKEELIEKLRIVHDMFEKEILLEEEIVFLRSFLQRLIDKYNRKVEDEKDILSYAREFLKKINHRFPIQGLAIADHMRLRNL